MVDFVALFLNFASKNRNLNFSQDENTVMAGVLVMYQVYTIFGEMVAKTCSTASWSTNCASYPPNITNSSVAFMSVHYVW